jgi:HlyD family secretion protein
MTRTRWLVFSVLAMGAVTAVVLIQRGPAGIAVDTVRATRQARFVSTVTASGEIVATRYADIGSSVMGKIVSLPVAEGERVRAGQVLARIDAVQAESDVSSAQAQVLALGATLQAARQQVQAAMADVVAAEARAADADQQFGRKKELFDAGLLAAAEFEAARAAADNARAQVAAARATVARVEHEAAAADGRINQARAAQRGASDILSKTAIVSPIDGVVTRLKVREGEMVVVGIQNQPGTTLMTVSDLGAIDAELKMAEADILRLALAQASTVTLEAMPGRRFAGKVVEIGASALPVSGTGAAAREFKVVVRLEQADPRLRPGLTCDAEIVTAERAGVITLPLQSVVLRRAAPGAAEQSGGVCRRGRPGEVRPGDGWCHRRTRHRSRRSGRRQPGHQRSVSSVAGTSGWCPGGEVLRRPVIDATSHEEPARRRGV